MKLIQINDPHTSAVAPRYRTDSYNNDIFDKLWQLRDIINEPEFDDDEAYIAFTGDLFHHPQPHKVPPWLLAEWMELLEDLATNAHIIIVPGNHDMISSGRVERQPIGLLDFIPGVDVCHAPRRFWTDDGLVIDAVPWEHYTNAVAVWQKLHSPLGPKPTPAADVLLIHGAVAVDSNPFYSTIDAAALAGIAKVVCYGHLHTPEPPYTVDGTTFVNPGALSRGSLTAADLSRTPQVGIITMTDGGQAVVEYRPLACKPAEEVFRIEVAEAEKASNEATQQFVASLGEASLQNIGLPNLESELERLCLNQPELHEKALEILRASQ